MHTSSAELFSLRSKNLLNALLTVRKKFEKFFFFVFKYFNICLVCLKSDRLNNTPNKKKTTNYFNGGQ